MALGIKLTVDFAFKKIFGSPENSVALIGLLNAILNLEEPIDTVEILNPFSIQEFAQQKLVVLDVRCRDSTGRWFNVEMQVTVYSGLIERMVYYACSLYVDQLEKGQNYASATTAISICLLRQVLFSETRQAHHRFQMVDRASGRELRDSIEVHTVELTKYNTHESTISIKSKLEQWVFLLLYAQDYDANELKRLLPGIEFSKAIDAIEIISSKTEDKLMYDQREKAQRDYEWALAGAREEGLEEGREEGREEDREEGLERGLEKGQWIGKLVLLKDLLGEPKVASSHLAKLDQKEIERQVLDLQQRLRYRET